MLEERRVEQRAEGIREVRGLEAEGEVPEIPLSAGLLRPAAPGVRIMQRAILLKEIPECPEERDEPNRAGFGQHLHVAVVQVEAVEHARVRERLEFPKSEMVGRKRAEIATAN